MTLMIYMVGSDLEAATAAATNDMKEMEESGIDLSKVKLLVYTGGSPKWHNAELEVPTDKHAVFELTKEGFVQVENFESASMGEADTLSGYLNYGYENYPSESYGLILWDHGNGPVMGYGSDILYESDALTLPEIEEALEASPFGEDNKLEFIGFDACLMASAELACVVDEYANYLVASQEVEPGFGWNYSFLKKCGKIDTKSLVTLIVDEYLAYCEEYFAQNEFFKSDVTLAAIDLAYANELEHAIDGLFGMAADDVSGSFNQLALDRVETRAFGRATTGSEYDLVDIQALMKSMNASYENETQTVQDILGKMVVHSGSNTAESCGLSLYYPYYNKKYYEYSWKESYEELDLLPNYIKYLERYGQIWLGTDMKEYFSGELVTKEGEAGTYTLQLTEEQADRYAEGGFYILKRQGEDAYSSIYYSQNVTNENGLLTADFDGKVLYYGTDVGFKAIPVARGLDRVDGETRYALFPNLTGSVKDSLESDTLFCRLVVSVDEESGEVSVIDFSANSDEEIQTGKKPQVNLDEWVRVQFYEITGRYLTRDEDGRIQNFWDWPEGEWIVWNEIALADGLTFSYEPLYDDGGEYYLMFDIMDVQGNRYGSELYPITLEEKPEEKETEPTDAGTMEANVLTVFERDGVTLNLNLVKDDTMGAATYCFSAENTNDYPVRLYLEDVSINQGISCTDAMGYLAVEPHETAYSFMNEVTLACMMEKTEHPVQLEFSVRMYNADNDKTLVNSEKFEVHFAETAKAELFFLPYKGVLAKEQKLLEEENGISVTLLGAGGYMTRNNAWQYSENGALYSILRIENTSSEEQEVRIDGMTFDDVYVPAEDIYTNYAKEMSLKPGQIFYYKWELSEARLTELGLSDIENFTYEITRQSANETNIETLAVSLTKE